MATQTETIQVSGIRCEKFVRVVNQKKSRFGFVRSKIRFPFEIAHCVNQNVFIVRNNQTDVWMFAENHFFVRVSVVGFRKRKIVGVATRGAFVARLKILRILTYERLCQFERESFFADTFRARKY